MLSSASHDGPRWPTYRDFNGFYREEYGSVLGLAIALTGDRSVAEEVVQDAFEAAWASWAKVGQMDKPEAWVRRVVANRSVSVYRRAATRARFLRRADANEPLVGIPTEALEVIFAMRGLPRRQAQALWLRYMDDLTVAEIANIMGCGAETVKTHLGRGLARLKELLE